MAVTLLPELVLPRRYPGVALRAIAEGPFDRTISAATRATDAARPSTQAVLAAVRDAAAALPPRLNQSSGRPTWGASGIGGFRRYRRLLSMGGPSRCPWARCLAADPA